MAHHLTLLFPEVNLTIPGQALGHRLNDWTGWTLNPPVAAFVGTLALTLAVNVVSLLPYLGAWLSLAAILIALGAVLLTGYGTRTFVPASERERLSASITR